MAVIIIDPGHGGHAPAGNSSPLGARGPAGTLEKDVVLALAERLVRHLGPGANLTRRGDANLSLAERAAAARRCGADVFVSLHAHGDADRGAEAYVHPRAGAGSRALAQALQRALQRHGGAGEVRTAELAVLSPGHHAGHTAACLVEVDGLGHDERRLRDDRELDRLARALAGGVREHLGRRAYGSGDGEEAIRALAARQIREFGGIVVAMHVTSRTWGVSHETDGYDTFKSHARQFALDHQAIGLAADGSLCVGAGAAFELTRPVAALLDDLAARLDLRDAAGDPLPMRVRMLGLFTHGVERSVMADVRVAGEVGYAKYFTEDAVYATFVDTIARHSANDVRVLMFACRTAGKFHDKDGHRITHPYAEQLADEIAARLQAREGATPVRAEVWGHEYTGHVTANHRLVCLIHDQVAGGSRREEVDEFIATTFLRSAISVITGRDQPSFAAYAEADALEAAALTAHRRGLTLKVREDLDVDPDEDGATHVRLVFNRDLAQIGLPRLLSALEHDFYNDTHAGPELAALLYSGTTEVRGRFAQGYAAVQTMLAELFSEAWTNLVALAQREGWSAPETPAGVAAKAAERAAARVQRLRARERRRAELKRREERQKAAHVHA